MIVRTLGIRPELFRLKIDRTLGQHQERFSGQLSKCILQSQNNRIRKPSNQPRRCHRSPSKQRCKMWLEPRKKLSHKTQTAQKFAELPRRDNIPFLFKCENTRAAWQLFFTARTWAKPHRFDSSVTLLLRRVVQSKTQWHSNVLKLLKLLQKSSQASKTFFQLLQIKRLQLKLTNNLPNSYQINSQHQVPKTWVKQHPKTPKTQKQTKIHLQALPCTNWFHLVPNWFLPGSYRFLWVL